MCKSLEKGDMALRFQARLGGSERSGSTLAVVSSTRSHGTAGRRCLKHGLHIFPNEFGWFFGDERTVLIVVKRTKQKC